MSENRLNALGALVEEVTKDDFDPEKVKGLLLQLGIPYSEDPMQLLNNILKGIHFEEPKNEQQV
jgi:hypothetical protein